MVSSIFTKAPLAGSTGNHDYCDIGNGKVTIGSYLTDNAYNHPKNAPEGYTEGVYWFKWNSVLFITLDSETGTTGYHEQMVWFKEVMETVPHQYCVVMCHRPAWGSGDSTNVANIWTPVFKEYNVGFLHGKMKNKEKNKIAKVVSEIAPSRPKSKTNIKTSKKSKHFYQY